jgi:hypothetical protein
MALAIVGTAGRLSRFDYGPDEYKSMIANAQKTYQTLGKPPIISGGASLSDHMAVHIFLMAPFSWEVNLTLYLPAKWDHEKCQYEETSEGKSSNRYHRRFSKMVGINSLRELDHVIQCKGVTTIVKPGFKNRNTLIAEKCAYMLAFTHYSLTIPDTPGTLDTWNKFTGPDDRKWVYPIF